MPECGETARQIADAWWRAQDASPTHDAPDTLVVAIQSALTAARAEAEQETDKARRANQGYIYELQNRVGMAEAERDAARAELAEARGAALREVIEHVKANYYAGATEDLIAWLRALAAEEAGQ